MGYLRGLCVCVCVSLFLSGVSSSVFGAYLAEEIVNPSTKIKKTSDFLRDAAASNLISIGETHGAGVERQVLHDIYQKLFQDLNEKPKCLVETFDLLLRPQDIVTPLLKSGCQSILSIQGNSETSTAFTRPLQESMGKGARVLTHTGFRHILPFGLLFPYDDPPTEVDTNPENTISSQIPEKLALKTKLTALVPVNLGDLYLTVLAGELGKIVGKSPLEVTEGLQNLKQKVEILFSQPNLRPFKNPAQNLIMLESLQSSSPSRKVYLSLVSNQPINFNLLEKLVAAPEFNNFLQRNVTTMRLHCFMASVDTGFDNLTIEAGSLFFFNTHEYIEIKSDGTILMGDANNS